MRTVTVSEAKAHWLDIIARAESGEPISITRWGKPVGELHPAPGSAGQPTDQAREPKPA
jgi:prevent-host-death family protein